MREIKFRGISDLTSKWVYGGYALLESGVNIIVTGAVEHIGDKNILKFNAVKYKTAGEYTGLKDKNGKEIYEGDILKHDIKTFMPFIMEWDNEAGCWTQYAPRSTIEVLGNIYENPELLEIKEKQKLCLKSK